MKDIRYLVGALIGLGGGSGVYAQAASGGGTDFSPFIGIALMFAILFFFIILPQNRKNKKHTEFLNSLQKGDAVFTQAGLYGRIYGISDRIVTLEIAPNVRVRIDRQTVAGKDATGGDNVSIKAASQS